MNATPATFYLDNVVITNYWDYNTTDLNNDGDTDTLDVKEFADNWLLYGLGDFTGDGTVNFSDWAYFTQNWE